MRLTSQCLTRRAVLALTSIGLCLAATMAGVRMHGWAGPAPAWGAAGLTRGPNLTRLTAEAVTISWRTDGPGECGLAIAPTGGAVSFVTGTTGTSCTMTVEGLSPGTHYTYIPLQDGVPLASATEFVTDDPAAPFAFLVVGDSGTGGAAQQAVRNRMLGEPASFILHTGDMLAEDGGAPNADQNFFAPYTDLVRRLMFWPCVGAADLAEDGGAAWRDAFSTPANNPAGAPSYYSFDFGNAHMVVIDSNGDTAPGSDESAFIDADLHASTAAWKIAVLHHSLYSGDAHADVRANLTPLFDLNHVDLVFAGDAHRYERTVPLRAGNVADPDAGTVYITTGGGGATLESSAPGPFTAYTESTYHFIRVAVDGDTLVAAMIDVDRVVRDGFTLAKPSVSSTTTSTTTTSSTTLPSTSTSTTTTTTSSTTTSTSTSTSTSTTTSTTLMLTFAPVADTYVDAAVPTKVLGASKVMTASGKPARIGYLRFSVGGLAGKLVTRATLRLTIDGAKGADGPNGGTVASISNHAWLEKKVTYKTRPAVDGPILASQGAVTRNQVIDFDVTGALRGDGSYDFALTSVSPDLVSYRTREALTGRPQLVLKVGPPTTTTTTSTTTSTSATSSTTTTTEPPPGAHQIKTVFVLMMENQPWSNIKGNPKAPYINNTLLPTFAHAENYRAGGVFPSLPNYMMLEGGDTFGLFNLSLLPTMFRIDTTDHLTTYLNNAGIAWRSYSELLPGNGTVCPLTEAGFYSLDHNVFAYFNDITGNPPSATNPYCIQHIRPYTEFAHDLSSNTVARYNFIIPSDDHQGEKKAPPLNNMIAQADTWLSQQVPLILASQAYRDGGVLLIVWDEDFPHGFDRPIGCIVVSSLAKRGYANTIAYSQASTLRTVQEIFGVTPFLRAAATATDLSDLFTSFP